MQDKRLWRNESWGFLFDRESAGESIPCQNAAEHQTGGIKTARPLSRKMGRGLQGGGFRAEGFGVSGAVFVSRGIARKNVVSNRDGNLSFRYQNSETRKMETRTLSGVEFLRKILLHILPKGFGARAISAFCIPTASWSNWCTVKPVAIPPPQPRPVVSCTCCGKPMRIVAHAGESVGRIPHTASLMPIRETAM